MEVWLWLIVLILAVVIEMMTTQLVCIWFAGGALVGLVAHFLHAPLWLQVILALMCGLLLIVMHRQNILRLVAGKERKLELGGKPAALKERPAKEAKPKTEVKFNVFENVDDEEE